MKFLRTNRSTVKVFCLILAGSLLLTGCFQEKQTELPIYGVIGSSALTELVPFTKDLCVVPKNEDVDKADGMDAASSLIFDITEQKVLYADNIYQKLYPASVTKIMTALVALKYGNLSDTVTISYEASHISEWGAKKCGFQEGDKIILEDLLYAFLIYSGNDAGIAIAEHIAGSEKKFVSLMNKEAKRIGATGSHFVNSHGLHNDKHYTTTYDIYLIFHECIKDDTFLSIIQSPSCNISYEDKDGLVHKVSYESTNRYLIGKEAAPDGVTVIGGKTGTTSRAGSCLVLLSKNADEHSFISVIFKSETGDTLFSQMSQLLQMEE